MYWCAMSKARLHAADGYSRSLEQGRAGVALVTSGPGVTNAVTGIATAYMDSIPMVVHHRPGADCMRSARTLSRRCDTVGITRPCVKHNFLVKDVAGPGRDDQEGVLPRHHRDGPGRWSSTFRRT